MTPQLHPTRNGTRVHVSCRVPQSLHVQLTDIARRDKRRISDVFRMALDEFVARKRVLEPPLPMDDDVA